MAADAQTIITGCGYVGLELGKLLLEQQQSPLCVVKSDASATKLSEYNLHSLLLDLDRPDVSSQLLNLQGANVYYFVPPPNNKNYDDKRIDRFLNLFGSGKPRRIVYISTSGVYGDCKGKWINETQPINPITQRAKRRVYAEQSLIRFCQQYDSEYFILRVGGIYGTTRLPIERLKDVKVICPDEAPFSNRIHVNDLARVCHTAMLAKEKNEILNVADGHPTSMTDYYYQIADLAELPRPPCVPMSQAENQLSPGMLSFINESRRLSIEKMQSLLKVQLQFPTLRLGLEHCFRQLRTM